MADYFKIDGGGRIVFGGHYGADWMSNLGILRGASSEILQISGATAALSATNPLWVSLMNSTTPGRTAAFSATSDVNISLSGADWGLAADCSAELRVYAINDAGTLKWGVSLSGGYTAILNSETDTTPANITLKKHMLVNTGLTAGTWPCREVGWVSCVFTNAGNVWAVGQAAGSVNVGVPCISNTNWTAWTPTGSWTTNTTYTGVWRRVGEEMEIRVKVALSGAPNDAVLTINLPSNYAIDTAAILSFALRGVDIGSCFLRDNSGNTYEGSVSYNSTTAVQLKYMTTAVAGIECGTQVAKVAPMAWAADDYITLTASFPIATWSAN